MNDYKAIIFDMDGTLINSMNIWAVADEKFVTELGFEYDHSVSLAMKTMHFDSACAFLIDTFGIKMSEKEVGRAIISLVEDAYKNDVTLKEYALDFIKLQHKKGIKMCVATSNKRVLAEISLKSLGVINYFDFIITSDDVGNDKNYPDIFLEAAKKMNTAPKKTLVFEDSIHAVKTASDANFVTIGVYDDYSAHEFDELKRISHKTIHSFSEMIQVDTKDI